jgi:FixJ family two-component response regulator
MTGKIYIIDDDEAVRDSLRVLFEVHGFPVEDFTSGTEFLAQYTPTSQGCVLLDVNLPGLDGFEVLSRLEASGNHPPVIIMTARTDSQTSARASEAGAAGFVQKPFATAHLLSLVRDSLPG